MNVRNPLSASAGLMCITCGYVHNIIECFLNKKKSIFQVRITQSIALILFKVMLVSDDTFVR